MVIHEPCNYASNVAYYHDATEMCKSQASLSIPRKDDTFLHLRNFQVFSIWLWKLAHINTLCAISQ